MIKKFALKSYRNYKVTAEIYNSAVDVVRDCSTRKITDENFNDMQKNLGGNDADWCGVSSYEEALQYLENGYQPVVDKMKSEIKATLQGQGKRISFFNDIVGYAPVVPLAILGVPNSMINSKMKSIKAKVVDVYYDLTFPFYVESEEIIKTGSDVIAQILSLEQQGYRFNLYAVQSYSGSASCDMMCVKLKDALQPLDLKRISFPLTHTGFFRVIGFDWYSKCPEAKYRSAYGHSLSSEVKDSKIMTEMFKEMFGKNAIYISGRKLLEMKDNKKEYLKEVMTNASSN